MKKEEEQRDFAMSFAELEQFVRNVISSMRRDAAEFANYGVGTGDINGFENLCNAFEDLPTDAELEGMVTIKTQAKDAKADELRVETREITTRVEVKFGENSGQYRSLDIEGLTKLSDPSLLRCARRVHRRATDMLADLASEGLTQQILDDYDVLIQGFEDALDDKDDAVKDRDIATNNRVQKANELYEFLSNYCNYGKRIWINTNEAKYNDYVIYPTVGGGGSPGNPPAAPLNLAYDIGHGKYSWEPAAGATSYQLQYKSITETEWLEAYSGAETSAIFNPGSGDFEFKVRARNAGGYGDYSVPIAVHIDLLAPEIWELVYNPSTNKVTLQWHASIGAEVNDIYQSVVPIGQPAGEFIMVDTIAGQVYQHDVTTYDVTEYYYIVARNASGSSGPSEVVSVDVAVV